MMHTRIVWHYDVNCSICGLEGSVRVSDNDFREFRQSQFAVESLSKGFAVRRLAQSANDTAIECVDCGALAN